MRHIYNADEWGLFCLLSARPEASSDRRDLPWRKMYTGVTHGVAVHKQRWLRQMGTHHYWTVCETTVLQKCKEATRDLLCQLKGMDYVGDHQRHSAYTLLM